MFFGGFGFDDDELHRGDWSEKSGAASAREEAARAAFTALAGKTSGATTVELLKPSTHLTQPCWRDFKKFVGQHAGWSAKRRQATDDEKRQHGETRKAAVFFVDVTYKPPASKKTAAAGKKTVKKTPLDKAAEDAAKARMASGMSAWMAGAKRPSEEEKEAAHFAAPASKKLCVEQEEEEVKEARTEEATKTDTEAAPAAGEKKKQGYVLAISRKVEVVAIDWNMFTDMRPDERSDAHDELNNKAKAYALGGEEPLCYTLEDEELPPWVLAKFQKPGDITRTAWRERLYRQATHEFETVEEANRAAKEIVEKALTAPVPDCFSLVHAREGDETIEKYNIRPELIEAKPKPGSHGRLDKFTMPPSDTAAQRIGGSTADGLEAYKARFMLYCDPYGADLYNVVSATLTCRVEAVDL